MKRSAKICFVVPSCVYASNWAHEVMIMQDMYLCIVEVQQWCVCTVIDTSCVLCNYIIITFVIFYRRLEGPLASKIRSLHNHLYEISSVCAFKYDLLPIGREQLHKILISVKNSLKNRQVCQIRQFSRPQVCTFEVVQN